MPAFDLASWRETYREREIAPDALREVIPAGSRICFGSGDSEPTLYTNMLIRDARYFSDCEFLHFFTLSNQKFFDEEHPSSFRHNSLSIIGCAELRRAVNSGAADFTPIMTHDAARMMQDGQLRVDVALLQVSPPDKNGYCSLGINVDINHAIVKHAVLVIAHVNPRMPRTMGDSFIHFPTEIDRFTWQDHPLLEFSPPATSDVHHAVARNVARLVENGATLNLGTGKIPYVLPRHLAGKRDLALYGEVLMEPVMELIQDGVVSCMGNVHPHCMTTFVLGTRRFHEFVDANPFVEFHPTSTIADICNIVANQKLCSVYGALAVDLLGQASNHAGTMLHSGTGCEPDFMRGAMLSPGGKAIVALPSRTAVGASRVVASLPPGLVDLRAVDLQYVVTEYGIAYLHGKSIRERVLQLIGVAAPEFRNDLLAEAKRLNYVYEDQELPATRDGIPVVCPDIGWTFTTRTKGPVHFRPAGPADERALQEFFYGLSERDRLHRFLSYRMTFSHEETQKQIACDYQTSMVIVGTAGRDELDDVVAEGAFYRDENSNLAEVSVTVREDFRGQGLAKHVFRKIIDLARERGISGLFGEIYADNIAMFRVLNDLPHKVIFSDHGDTFEFYFRFSDVKEREQLRGAVSR